MENPKFLKEKYGLHNSEEVKKANKRIEVRTGEKVSENPAESIQNYLERLERLVLDPEKNQKKKMFRDESRPRSISLLREMIMNKYIRPNKEKMAHGAARVDERTMRELGIDVRYGEQELELRGEIAVEDLEKSLDNWISYLSDANEPYPTWFRYYAFRSVLDLGDYDKDKGEFTERSKGSTRLFPDIDRGALAYVEQMIESSKDSAMLDKLQKAQRVAANQDVPEDQLITKEKSVAFAKFSFAKQYAEGIKQNGEITPEMREETRGKWVKYQQGTDPTALWSSLQNKGTAWCTKGFATAETQLKGGDFYVYYTLDKQGNPTIPRIAIRMEGHNKISNDVRGVLDSQQNMEGNVVGILEEKLKEFGPEADIFKKKSVDMKLLTAIENKVKTKQGLNKEDLIFLYEINGSIEGFGYQCDPRIEELRSQRDLKKDMPIIFECTLEQIAYAPEEINKNTKAYVGVWNPTVLKLLPGNITHIYEKFPDKKVFLRDIELNPDIKNADTAEKSLLEKGYKIVKWAKDILKKTSFSKEKKSFKLVSFSVGSLGFPNGAITKEIFKKAKELGFELAPAEVGPQMRLQYQDQPMNEYLFMAMEQITDSSGNPDVFSVGRSDGGSWLDAYITDPDDRWYAVTQFVFVSRQ